MRHGGRSIVWVAFKSRRFRRARVEGKMHIADAAQNAGAH